MWIWQQQDWPTFTWDHELVASLLCKVNFNQGKLLGQMGQANEQTTLDTLLANIVHSSAIEGEKLNASSVRSSLANKLGVQEANPYPTSKQTEGLAEMMVDAIDNWKTELTIGRILHWHHLLFPDIQSALNPIVGGVLRGDMPMQVVSGRIDRPMVHFEAPPRQSLEEEIQQFVDWFNRSKQDAKLNPILRAAITHLWFVTLHPLDDGNGRITRLLTDLALSQAESQSIRLYAMSVSILNRRKSYYEILEKTQKGNLNITAWIMWFLETLNQTFLDTLKNIEETVLKTQFWQRVDQTALSKEQAKVLNRLLDGNFSDGISSSQYQKVAKVSRATATRHLSQLVLIKCLVKTPAGGRSQRYKIYE